MTLKRIVTFVLLWLLSAGTVHVLGLEGWYYIGMGIVAWLFIASALLPVVYEDEGEKDENGN